MQTIYPTTLTPVEYLQQDGATQVPKPEICTHCGAAGSPEALGYYERWISHLLEALRIRVRRFWCSRCRVSISCLPDFAQPYRVVNSQTVQAGFEGGTGPPEVHWRWLIAAYWKKFAAHLKALVLRVANALGPCPVEVTPESFWKLILQQCDCLAAGTEELVRQFRICLFGTYRCHQPQEIAK